MKSEIIDLLNSNSTCKNWVDYPIDVRMASGQIVDNQPLICGGRKDTFGFDDVADCYKIGPQSAVPSKSLATARGFSSAGVFNNELFIVGGYGNGTLSSTEYISENNQTNGVDAPIKALGHCVIQINAKEILLTGGGTIK